MFGFRPAGSSPSGRRPAPVTALGFV